ncbi:HDOD domain-containing protein, partial [Brucella gallinifaecis]|uniref:HDOD domain-containing protein n=1 Tax=Brucella gallinifaecis TaxID=215590 RepID=UPI00235EE859
QAEERTIGVNHAVVGAMLVQHWQFPAHIVDIISRHHHDYVRDGLGESLYLADFLAQAMLQAGVDEAIELDPEV